MNPGSLLVCLPVVVYVLVFAIERLNRNGWRAATLRAATIWGVLVTAVTEALSAVYLLGRPGIGVAWLLIAAVAAVCLSRAIFRSKERGDLRELTSGWGKTIKESWSVDLALAACALLVILLVGVIALTAPPNTWDAMTYHMPRIVHWLHNRTVRFYPTHELRQLALQPWAEYAISQLHALYGGDRFDNLIQWFSLAGSALGVSLIAALLGASASGQVLASVICVTIPQGILQATGAKNDFVLAFWLVVLSYFLIAYKREQSFRNALGTGSALGLACLTKGTAYVFAPTVILAMLCLLPWTKFRTISKHLLTAACVVLTLNCGVYVRNYALFNSPLGPVAYAPPNGLKLTNNRFGFSVTASNLLRNIALHLGTARTSTNSHEEKLVNSAEHYLGNDPNDPSTTWDGTVFHVPQFSLHEDVAGNPWHCLLILITLAVWIVQGRSAGPKELSMVLIGLLGAFILFCSVLKWQPWNTRLHLPLFVMWAAVSGAVLSRSVPRAVTSVLALLLLFAVIPDIFKNETRPLVPLASNIFHQPRLSQYFDARRDLGETYAEAAQYAQNQRCGKLGLAMPSDSFEYPLLVLLSDESGDRDIADAGVHNSSAAYQKVENDSGPCMIICPECGQRALEFTTGPMKLPSVRSFGNVNVFSRASLSSMDECSIQFLDGWYPEERGGVDRWRWSAGKDKISVTVLRDLDLRVSSTIFSITRPNKVHVFVNGRESAKIEIPSEFKTPATITLHVRNGVNIVEFVSESKGVRSAADPRTLAVAVSDLAVQNQKGSSCREIR